MGKFSHSKTTHTGFLVSKGCLRTYQLHCLHRLCNAKNLNHAFEVVSEHVQTHFRRYVVHATRQEVCPAHSVLERSKDVFNRAFARRHGVWHAVQTLRHLLHYRSMFPSPDAPVRADRTLGHDCTSDTGTAPVGAHLHSFLVAGVAVDGALPCGAQVFIIAGDVDEVGSIETTFGFCVRCHRLGNNRCNPRIITGLEFNAAVVATVGNGLELVLTHGLACSQCDLTQL